MLFDLTLDKITQCQDERMRVKGRGRGMVRISFHSIKHSVVYAEYQ